MIVGAIAWVQDQTASFSEPEVPVSESVEHGASLMSQRCVRRLLCNRKRRSMSVGQRAILDCRRDQPDGAAGRRTHGSFLRGGMGDIFI
jgi:hypothetical protein